MHRRNFITGMLTAPMIVRASSLDALPRGVPVRGTDAIQVVVSYNRKFWQVHTFTGVDISATLRDLNGADHGPGVEIAARKIRFLDDFEPTCIQQHAAESFVGSGDEFRAWLGLTQ